MYACIHVHTYVQIDRHSMYYHTYKVKVYTPFKFFTLNVFVVCSLLTYSYILFCRPIAGSVNLCPDAIQRSDMDRVVATVKHELLHAMVCYIHIRIYCHI